MTKRNNSKTFSSKKLDMNVLGSLQQQGLSERVIATELQRRGIDVSQSTVHRRLNLLKTGGNFDKNHGKKCQKKLDNRVVRMMVRQIRTQRLVTTRQLHAFVVQLGYKVCVRTVYRSLKSVPTLRLRRPRTTIHLLPKHKKDRRTWAMNCLEDKIDWTKVWFADEKLWYIDGPVNRPKFWQDVRDPVVGIPVKGRRNTSVCVFGAISITGVSELIVIPSHFDWEVYCQTVKAALLSDRQNQNCTLYHDRNPPHTHKHTQTWMSDNGMQAVLLPPKSADLNPIENVWALMSRQVYSETQTYNNTHSLQAAIQAAWYRIQKNRLLRRNLVGSMTERLRAVVRAKGNLTNF